MSPEKNRNITVFGHGNGWGKTIAKASAEHFDRVLGVEIDTSAQETSEMLAASQVAFLAAPDDKIAEIIETHRQRLSVMQVLDCATNKGPFQKGLIELSESEKASVTSTHPMVISSSPTQGTNVIIMPLNERSGPSEQTARAIYDNLGMVPKSFPFEKHGDYMAVTQFFPHLIQRLGIHIMRHEIKRRGLSFAQVMDIAPANTLITEGALGRVAMQRPDVSAGIIHQAITENGGQETIEEIVNELRRILAGCNNAGRAALTHIFYEAVTALDPTGEWRKAMKQRTDAQLEVTRKF